MDGLEVPQPLAGFRIEGDEAVAEQVVAETVAAVEVEARCAEWDVRDAASFVDRQLAPVVDAAAVGERGLGPGLGADFAFLGHAVERPRELAGPHVVGVRVAGARDVGRAAGRQRQDDQVLEDASGIAGLQRAHAGHISIEAEP